MEHVDVVESIVFVRATATEKARELKAEALELRRLSVMV
jgi:hypothetical protein